MTAETAAAILDDLVDLAEDVAGAERAHASLLPPREGPGECLVNLPLPREYGVLFYETAIWDTPQRSYVLERGVRRLRRETKVCSDEPTRDGRW